MTRPGRVPDPAVVFWLTKAASTALGEAVSDFSIRIMPPILAVLLGFALFVGALAWQLRRRRYVPETYWLAVAAVGVFGAMAADVVHVVLGLPYVVSATLYALIPTAVIGYRFLRWNAVFAFWFAYVLTRPLGASVADWLGKPSTEGGVGFGSGWVSLAFALTMVALVILMKVRDPSGRPSAQ